MEAPWESAYSESKTRREIFLEREITARRRQKIEVGNASLSLHGDMPYFSARFRNLESIGLLTRRTAVDF